MTVPSRHAALLRWLGRTLLLLPWILLVLGGLYAALRFLPDVPVRYSDPVEHFKYGSTGGERESGFPTGSGRPCRRSVPNICPAATPRSA
ncbi:hypothetical protein ACFSHR_07560 [Azotobacter chroococcum]